MYSSYARSHEVMKGKAAHFELLNHQTTPIEQLVHHCARKSSFATDRLARLARAFEDVENLDPFSGVSHSNSLEQLKPQSPDLSTDQRSKEQRMNLSD